jgi:hypothetical protein
MNAKEAAALCRLAKAACPQQAIDEHTPEAWFLLMGNVRFEDARDALVAITQRQPFVAPSEIIAEVRRVRGKRIAEFGPIEPPSDLDVGAYHDWFISLRTRIGNGELTRAQYEAERKAAGITGDRTVPPLEGVFRRIDDEGAA